MVLARSSEEREKKAPEQKFANWHQLYLGENQLLNRQRQLLFLFGESSSKGQRKKARHKTFSSSSLRAFLTSLVLVLSTKRDWTEQRERGQQLLCGERDGIYVYKTLYNNEASPPS